jgi:hypothetical protein
MPSRYEFLMTGCTPEEWNEMFPPEDAKNRLGGHR